MIRSKDIGLKRMPSSSCACLALGLLVVAMISGGARADVFNIEIDYMVDSGIGGHSHRPSNTEIDAVVQMFACQGHTLNIVVDEAIPHYTQIQNDPDNCGSVFNYSGVNGSFGKIKQTYFDRAGEGGWHYCIFVHFISDGECNWTGSSGIAEIGGDDFMVSLGDFDADIGTPWDRAGTLAHEFGHNLGLYHCGSSNPCGNPDDDPTRIGPFMPNLPSVMSYFYQLRGVRSNLECQGLVREGVSLFKNLDYSHGTMCSLDEAALDEDWGTGMTPVDWNCSGLIGGVVAQDLHDDSGGWCGAVTGFQVLSDYNEWANIRSSAFDRVDQAIPLPVSNCITADQVRRNWQVAGFCPQPPATPEACIGGDMIYADKNAASNGPGTCDRPFDGIEAATVSPRPGSMLFLAPGIYRPAVPLILQNRMTISSNGSVVIE